MSATQYLGEFNCKMDAKGRVMLPAALKKQLHPESQGKFVVNRGFEKHLNLYSFKDWERISAEINSLNLYVKKNRDFARYFFRGATELSLDSNSRLNMPKALLDYSGIKKEMVLFAYSNRIEIWAPDAYEGLLDDEPQDFSALAEEVMGRANDAGNNDIS